MFHTHLFIESTKDQEILYCRCGEVKNIHRHIWEKHEDTVNNLTQKKVGEIRKCKICGELKNFSIFD